MSLKTKYVDRLSIVNGVEEYEILDDLIKKKPAKIVFSIAKLVQVFLSKYCKNFAKINDFLLPLHRRILNFCVKIARLAKF